jgi:serine/threonine protein phosphatase PrpC
MNARAFAPDVFATPPMVPAVVFAGGAVEGAAVCHTGCVRSRNEDAWFADARAGVFVVADGMGGHQAGDRASALTVDSLSGLADAPPTTLDRAYTLRRAIELANRRVYDASAGDVRLRGMGTTVVALWLHGGQAHWAHVGDSRIYRLRDGVLRALTLDHSPVGDLVRIGRITPQQAAAFGPMRLLTRSVGTFPHVQVEAGQDATRPGDRYLLCSDGLTDVVPDATLARVLAAEADAAAATRSLALTALDAGGPDNVTALVVDVI